MKPKVVPISKQSWLVQCGGKSELLTKFRNLFTITRDGKSSKFTKDQLNEHYEGDIFNNVDREPLKKDVKHYINGFDIDYVKPLDANIQDGKPIFRKYTFSDIYYCAGYYGVKFDTVYVPLFCPKLSTVNKYNHLGPYKTSDELMQAIKNRKK